MNLSFLVVSQAIWNETWEGLRLRSGNSRESACVWGGHRSETSDEATQVHFIDDLPGIERGRLSHQTPREATELLFGDLRRSGQSIVADVHSHPGSWVGLSETDSTHPIEYRIGLFALVLPRFANGKPSLASAGVHIYLGNGNWKQLSLAEAKERVKIA